MNKNPAASNVHRASLMLCACTAALLSGCAAWTNPVANGIPVWMIPEELLAESKEGYEPIPWPMLQRTPEKKSLLVPGDVLGVYVEGVLGDESRLPPVNLPTSNNDPPSIGYPIPIRDDGTISIPLIDPLPVAGMTIEDAEAKLVQAYTVDKKILTPGEERIILTVIRQKHVQINVIRQDSLGRGQQQFIPTERGLLGNTLTAINTNEQSRGFVVDLPASEADVLTVLARTGGLPGLDAQPELLVYRRAGQRTQDDNLAVNFELQELAGLAEPEVIPLRRKEGDSVQIREQDIVLGDEDIVFLGVRKPEYYYTGGLLRNQQIPLPIDIDLTATEAVMRSGGPLLNGAFGGGNFQGTIVSNQMSSTNPSLLTILRKGPGNRRIPIRVDLNEALRDPREDILIQDGDALVLQQTTGEAFTRYFLDRLNVTTSGRIFQRGDASAGGSLGLP